MGRASPVPFRPPTFWALKARPSALLCRLSASIWCPCPLCASVQIEIGHYIPRPKKRRRLYTLRHQNFFFFSIFFPSLIARIVDQSSAQLGWEPWGDCMASTVVLKTHSSFRLSPSTFVCFFEKASFSLFFFHFFFSGRIVFQERIELARKRDTEQNGTTERETSVGGNKTDASRLVGVRPLWPLFMGFLVASSLCHQ